MRRGKCLRPGNVGRRLILEAKMGVGLAGERGDGLENEGKWLFLEAKMEVGLAEKWNDLS